MQPSVLTPVLGLTLTLMAACMLATAPATAQTQAAESPTQLLLDSARMWESRNRPDLARLALEKLLRAQPGHPQASMMLGDLELRSGRLQAAERVLGDMRQAHPNHPYTLELAASLRVQTRDRLKLATMRRLVETGRHEEALVEARALYPDGPPPGPLGMEYWRIQAQVPGGFEAARAGLADFARRYPDDPRYALGLAELLVTEVGTREQGLKQMAALAGDPEQDRAAVLSAWRRGLGYLSDSRSNLPYLRAYLAQVPQDAEIQRTVATIQSALLREQRRQQDPVYRRLATADAAIDAGRLTEAEQQIAAALAQRPNDGEALGTLGRLRMRQNRHAEAEGLFQRAMESDARNTAYWKREKDRARYWVALEDAEGLRDAQRYDAAQERLDYALRLRPGSEEAQALRATVLARQPQHSAAAERLYRRVLARDPGNRVASGGLLELLQTQDRSEEALAVLDELRRRAPDRQPEFNRLRADWLQQQAEQARLAGRDGASLRLLEDAQALTPDDPWLRYTLAREYAQRGLPDEARALMDEAIAAAPDSADAHYARALLLASLDDDSAALNALAAVPDAARSEGMHALDRRLRISIGRRLAAAAYAAGDRTAATDRLAATEVLAGDDPDQLAAVASSWIDMDQTDRGLGLLRPLVALTDDAALRLRWAQLLDQAERDAELAPVLASLDAQALPEAQQSDLRRLHRALLLRRAEHLADTGKPEAALALLAPALAQSPQDAELRLQRARWLADAGERQTAITELQTLQEQTAAADEITRGDLVSAWLYLDAVPRADTLAASMQQAAPDSIAARVAAARVARAQHQHNRAMRLYQAARGEELASNYQGYSAAQAGIEAIEARRDGYASAGVSLYSKSGDAGISEYTARQIPVEVHLPYRYEGEFFAIVDAVDADAGRLPAVFEDAALYGAVQAYGSAALGNFPNGAEQQARGVDIGLGWKADRLRIDLGTTPIGFPVENWVGGLRWSDDIGAYDYTVSLARRPVTGSLLSYAGARDPASGRTWGGVVSTGVDGRLAWSRGRFSSSASAGAYQLTGRNVLDNQQLTLRLAGDWALIRSEDQRLEIGLALSAWRYAEQLGEYSFGHGGYYSPQRYLSAALPLEWRGRWQAFAWRVRGAVSVSRTHLDAQAFYPDDPVLQAQAASMPLPSGYSAPIYDASDGGGTGYSLNGTLEYRISEHWFVGTGFDLERSEFYTPNFFSGYLRYDFDGRPAGIDFPPRPPTPYASY